MATMVIRTASFRDAEQSMRILSMLNDQRLHSRFCDVVLRVGEEQIFAHSNVLAAASPYFGSFLGMGSDAPRAFCESSPQVIEIHIDSADDNSGFGYGEAVRHVVDFMYTCTIELNSLIITQVIEIAKIMQMTCILDYCSRFQKGENGNLPQNKGTGMPVATPDFSLSRKILRKANASTETEQTMFLKSGGILVDALNQSAVLSVPNAEDNTTVQTVLTKDTLVVEGDTTLAHSDDNQAENEVKLHVKQNNSSETSEMTDAEGTLGLGNGDIVVDDIKKLVNSSFNSPAPMVVKSENTPAISSMERTLEVQSENVLVDVTCKDQIVGQGIIIPLPHTLPSQETNITDALRLLPIRGRRKGRRRRKRKPKEVLSDSDPELIQEPEDLDEENLKNEDVNTPGTCFERQEGDNVNAASETNFSQNVVTPTNATISPECDVLKTESESEKTTIPSRTRGRKPITSVMATWSSPRLRAGIPRSVYKSDYVMHSLIRRSRHSGSRGQCLPQHEEDTDTGEDGNLEEMGSLLGRLGTESEIGENQTPGLKFVCQTCDFTTSIFRVYRQHMKRHPETDTRSYTCTECDFHTTKARQLLQHRKKHLHEELICSFCEVQLDSPENFQLHLQRHAHALPYFCHSCDMRFKTRTQLATHLPKHMTEKPFVCQVCGNGFKWKHALKNHMVTHSATKDHLCDICGFSTAHKSQLKAHHLIHTGDTFKCPEPGCQFEATKRQNLKYHMVTHTQEKAHQCEVCGQAFSLIKNMRRHMLLHAETRPYHCSLCSYTTTRFDKLKEHKLKQHDIGQPPGKKMKYATRVQRLANRVADGPITIAEDGTIVQAVHTDGEGLRMVGPITIAQDGNSITISSDLTLTDETLTTIAQLATSTSQNTVDGSQPQEAQINISTPEGYPVIARVQFASNIDMGKCEVVGYMAQSE